MAGFGGLKTMGSKDSTAVKTKEVKEVKEDETAEESVEVVEVVGEIPVLARYTSHPIQNFCVGEFRFEHGLLEFTNQDTLDRFEALRETMSPREQNAVRVIDVAKAAEVAEEFLKQETKRIQGAQTSVGAE